MTDTPAETPTPSLATATPDVLIERYVFLRDNRDEIKAGQEAQLAPYETAIAMIASELEKRMVMSNLDSMKTTAGTVSRVVTSTAMCEDWAAFEKWAIDNKRLDMFMRRLTTGPIKEMIEETGQLPPGIRIQQQARVQVRRAARKQ